MKNFFLTLSDLFYPRHCMGCERALLEKEFLCDACWSQIKPISEPHCQICSYSLCDSNLKICSNCADRKIHFEFVVSAFQYPGLTQELLARYKYGRDQSLKPLLQQLIVNALQDKRLAQIDFAAIVPVPLHAVRERERGFNQVSPLAQAIARFKNLPLQSLLKRRLPTSFQAGSNREERLKNLAGAFALRRSAALRGNYLLVDDVLTTGATLDECAKVLLRGGAEQVWAVTLAR